MRKAVARTESSYLVVRQEHVSTKEFDVRSSVLTVGSKATVVTGVQTVSKAGLDSLLGRIADHRGADFSSIGEDLGRLVLAREIREVLPSQKDMHTYLFDNLRLDINILRKMDARRMEMYADNYGSRKVAVLAGLIKRMKRNEGHNAGA